MLLTGLALETFIEPDHGNVMLNKTSWKGRKAVIIGAARQGLSLARYLAKHDATVVVNDRLPETDLIRQRRALTDQLTTNDHAVEWVCGSHPMDILDGTDTVFVSGGVPHSVAEPQLPEAAIAPPSVRDNDAAPLGALGHEARQCLRRRVGDVAQADAATPGSRPGGA